MKKRIAENKAASGVKAPQTKSVMSMSNDELQAMKEANNLRGMVKDLMEQKDSYNNTIAQLQRDNHDMVLRGRDQEERLRQYEATINTQPRRLATIPRNLQRLVKRYAETIMEHQGNYYAKSLLYPFAEEVNGVRTPQLLPEMTTTSSVHSQLNFTYQESQNPQLRGPTIIFGNLAGFGPHPLFVLGGDTKFLDGQNTLRVAGRFVSQQTGNVDAPDGFDND
jgi:hypothetical protein